MRPYSLRQAAGSMYCSNRPMGAGVVVAVVAGGGGVGGGEGGVESLSVDCTASSFPDEGMPVSSASAASSSEALGAGAAVGGMSEEDAALTRLQAKNTYF